MTDRASGRGTGVLGWGLGLAWLATVALLAESMRHRNLTLSVALPLVFTCYFAFRVVSWLRSDERSVVEALALLPFLGSLMPLLTTWFERGFGAPVLLRDAAWGVAVVVVVHAFLEARVRWGDRIRWLSERNALIVWIVGMWILSTAIQVARFRLFAAGGSPEDTAFFWDTFRNWLATGVPTSAWADIWGHAALDHYLALHFSPILYPVFAAVALLPRLETMLLLQNLVLFAGCYLWARVLREQLQREGVGPGAEAGLWMVALFISHPITGAAFRAEVNPLLWALPVLALLHLAYLRRSLGWFCSLGLAVFAFREDLGLVVASYAVLAAIEGRYGRGSRLWLILPLAAGVLTLVVRQEVMPEFGVRDPSVFQRLFDTDRTGIVGFVISVAAQPIEAVARLFRPAHLELIGILLLTGLAWPGRNAILLLGIPYAALLALVGPDSELLRLGTHYAFIPGLYVLAAGTLYVFGTLAHDRAPIRASVLALLLVMASSVPVRLIVPEPAALRSPIAYRQEVLSDLGSIPDDALTAVPPHLLIGTSSIRATMLHDRDFFLNPEGRGMLPAYGLIPNGGTLAPTVEGGTEWALVLSGPVAVGHHYSLFGLEYQPRIPPVEPEGGSPSEARTSSEPTGRDRPQ